MSLELAANTAVLSVGTASASVEVPLPASLASWSHEVAITNTGSATARVTLGNAAGATGYPVLPNTTAVLHSPTSGIQMVSAIADSPTTLCITACTEAA